MSGEGEVAWDRRVERAVPPRTGEHLSPRPVGPRVSSEVHEEVVRAAGHEHVSAEHASTFELTTDDWLTPGGDCILGVEADRAPADFAPGFVDACRDREATITATLEAAGVEDAVAGRGHPDLTFDDDRSLVGRTSDHVDGRTVMVGADAAAADLDRKLVTALSRGAPLTVTLRVR